MLDPGVLWRVWLGRYTDPALIVAPCDASIEEIARAGRAALDERFQGQVRPEHVAHDSDFWTDALAAVDVTKIERADDVHLHPRFALTDGRGK